MQSYSSLPIQLSTPIPVSLLSYAHLTYSSLPYSVMHTYSGLPYSVMHIYSSLPYSVIHTYSSLS